MVNLSVNLGKLRLKNPVMLAAGVLGVSPSSLLRVANKGAGGVVTKSISLEPRTGYPNPVLVEVEGEGYVNAVGLSNPGAQSFRDELKKYLPFPVPLVGSIFGYKPEEYGNVASILEDSVDAFELNISCPSVSDVDSEIGTNLEVVKSAIRNVKDVTSKPVFVKLSPNVTKIVDIGLAAEGAGADGVVAINTVSAMVVDADFGRPILSALKGGLSGKPIRTIALRCVYELGKALTIPIVGCGGVFNWMDALNMIVSGASAVQIGTAIRFLGLDVFTQVVEGLELYLEDKGYSSVKQLVGAARI
ncbi:MAG: dihydroorotate dehydrogenase [Thermoproteota archaeon]